MVSKLSPAFFLDFVIACVGRVGTRVRALSDGTHGTQVCLLFTTTRLGLEKRGGNGKEKRRLSFAFFF